MRNFIYPSAVVLLIISGCYILGSGFVNTGKKFSPLTFEKEEKIHRHPLEWWYHFGFLKTDSAHGYEWALFSSFTRSAAGRNIMYDLIDMKTGKKYLNNELDITLAPIGLPPKNFTVIRELMRLSELPGKPIDLIYGRNKFKKTGNLYQLHYENPQFILDQTLVPASLPMLMEQTGMVGFPYPKSFYYYTIPRLKTKGELTLDGKKMNVTGEFWYDHQWGNPVGYVNIGWTWWGLKLTNGENLNIYRIRNLLTGKIIRQVINIQDTTGGVRYTSDALFTSHREWKSPGTKTSYPVEWTIDIPAAKRILHITPMVDDCESPILIYFYFWEGPCRVVVTNETNEQVISTGTGFQELVGFAIDKRPDILK